jgi:hypothetical protein
VPLNVVIVFWLPALMTSTPVTKMGEIEENVEEDIDKSDEECELDNDSDDELVNDDELTVVPDELIKIDSDEELVNEDGLNVDSNDELVDEDVDGVLFTHAESNKAKTAKNVTLGFIIKFILIIFKGFSSNPSRLAFIVIK